MWRRDHKGRKTGLRTSADGILPSRARARTKAPGLWFGAFGLQDLPALKQPVQGQTVPATCVLENVHVLFVKDNQGKDCLSLGVTQIRQMESCHFAYKVSHIPSRIQLIFPLTTDYKVVLFNRFILPSSSDSFTSTLTLCPTLHGLRKRSHQHFFSTNTGF